NAGIYPRQAPASYFENLSARSTGRNLQRHNASYHRHVNVGTERELRVSDDNLRVEILTVPLEARIFLDLEHHQNVPTRTTTRTDVPHTAHRHVLTGGDAGGNPHEDLLLTADASFAATLLARLGDDGAFTSTVRAGRDAYHLAEETALRAPHLAA